MKRIALAGLAALLVSLATTSATRAGDTVNLKLGGNNSAPTVTLGGADADADTLEVRCFRGGYYGGGYRGYSYYSGCRSYYAPAYYYRPSIAYSYYSYRPSYYCAPRVYYYSSCAPTYYYGISETQVTPTLKANIQQVPQVPPMEPADTQPKAIVPQGTGPYQYDGGPTNPVPMPQGTRPNTTPRPTVPLDGRPVSLPATTTTTPVKYTYPAYGQPTSGSQPQQERTLLIKK